MEANEVGSHKLALLSTQRDGMGVVTTDRGMEWSEAQDDTIVQDVVDVAKPEV
jgi:hypothetical protein